MTLVDDAQRELRLLEQHWVSLLAWLAERSATKPDDLVTAWDADEYFRASQRFEAAKKAVGRANNAWTVLHFIDFGRHAELAGFHEKMLAPLGKPARNWRSILGQHANDGLVGLRNHLQHGARFEMLALSQQQRAIDLFKAQRASLLQWWPDCPVTQPAPPAETDDMRAALRVLSSDPADTAPLLLQLGMRDSKDRNRNLINTTGIPSELTKEFEAELDGLFRVGEKEMGSAQAAVYLAVMREWKPRSGERERIRRRLAKKLRERDTERVRVIIFVESAREELRRAEGEDRQRRDIEIVLPRVRDTGVATVRAAIARDAPTRHHVDLLRSLAVTGATSVPEVTRKWVAAFSVEQVTDRFYKEFRDLRDRLIDELLAHNADNPALQRDRTKDAEFDLELHAFGTRQLSRILFLWFLQQKRWLGDSPGSGNLNFVSKIFSDHGGGSDTFFSGVLVPIFFDGLGRRTGERRKKIVETYGWMPPLGGSIFSAGANDFEQRIFDFDDEGVPRRRIVLPDDLFDPRADERDVPAGRRPPRKRSVLGLLRGYRFTTQESTPDDQSVDPDPELLGKVFENLYQADERHATGAYYTPREIVQFMCRQTLDGYLIEQTGRTQDDLDWLRQEAEDPTLDDRKLKPDESNDLIEALERVRVLDPAVGSGAFLLSMMHEIVTLRRGVEQADDRIVNRASSDVATWKGRVASNSLYGVDINPMAVEICHLRLWLSIIVDLDATHSRDIPTLPNLDFRIVAGDSLIDRMGPEPFFESLPRDETREIELWLHTKVIDLQKELDALKNRFTLAEGVPEKDQKRLRDLRQKIRAKQVEIAHVQLAHSLDKAEADLNLLQGPKAKAATKKKITEVMARATNLRALQAGLRADGTYQKPFLWPVNFHEVFEAGGFDIVVANPPYIRVEDQDPVDKKTYPFAFGEALSPHADLLVCFYARAVQVLREGGQLAFITSNSFVKRAYGKTIQEFLADNLRIDTVIDFGETSVFDAVVEPYVLIGSKATPGEDHEVNGHFLFVEIARRAGTRSSVAAVREQLGDLDSLLAADHVRLPQRTFAENDWKIEAPEVIALYNRLMSQGTPLGEFVQGRMHYGIKTGDDDAFVIDEAKRAELIAASVGSAELIKPCLRGGDIKRWKPEPAGRYVIAIQNTGDADAHNPWGGAKTEKDARRIFRETYPAIEKHLSMYETSYVNKKGKTKPGLRSRSDQGKWWWELRACAYYREFSEPKIIWPDISRSLRFALDGGGSLADTTCFFMTGQPVWLVAVLNSTFGEFLLCQLTTSIRGGFMRLKMAYIEPFPVPQPGPELARKLSDLVSAIDSATPAAVDLLVSEAYRLRKEDLELVRAWFDRRSIVIAADDDEPTDDDDNDGN